MHLIFGVDWAVSLGCFFAARISDLETQILE